MTNYELLKMAISAREHAYCPYSGFAVGAALLCQDGTVHTGCNVENMAYGPTNCAERTAFFSAIAAGKRKFQAIAIAGGKDALEICYPCGICRQVMAEFCDGSRFHVICGTKESDLEIWKLEELLPNSFTLKS